MTDEQFDEAVRLYRDEAWSMQRVALHLDVCRIKLTARMREAGIRPRSRSEAAKLRQEREKREQAEAPEAAIEGAEAAWREAMAGQKFENLKVKSGPARFVVPNIVEGRAI